VVGFVVGFLNVWWDFWDISNNSIMLFSNFMKMKLVLDVSI